MEDKVCIKNYGEKNVFEEPLGKHGRRRRDGIETDRNETCCENGK
jgi:hypothetical protein